MNSRLTFSKIGGFMGALLLVQLISCRSANDDQKNRDLDPSNEQTSRTLRVFAGAGPGDSKFVLAPYFDTRLREELTDALIDDALEKTGEESLMAGLWVIHYADEGERSEPVVLPGWQSVIWGVARDGREFSDRVWSPSEAAKLPKMVRRLAYLDERERTVAPGDQITIMTWLPLERWDFLLKIEVRSPDESWPLTPRQVPLGNWERFRDSLDFSFLQQSSASGG